MDKNFDPSHKASVRVLILFFVAPKNALLCGGYSQGSARLVAYIGIGVNPLVTVYPCVGRLSC